MSSSHLALGSLGESYAAAYLEQLGYLLVAANFTLPVGRTRSGVVVNAEIDLVAYDGPCLCFVEVKTRKAGATLPPQVNVDLRKRRQISRAARGYRHMFGLDEEVFRFDVVTVVIDQGSVSEIELLKNFWRDDRKRKSRHFYD